MSIFKRDLQKYFRQAKSELLCPWKTRKQIMADLKKNVSLYLEEHPEAAIENILHTFGSPRQIAASYVEELPTPELMKKLKLRRRILRCTISIVGGAVLLCILLWVFTLVSGLIMVHNSSEPYIETYIEEIP